MFTGIVERTGTILSLMDLGGVKRLTVDVGDLALRLREGDSLAISGVCLTALEVEKGAAAGLFYADLAAETLAKTSLGTLSAGALVNLELPVVAGSPLGGHIVQGHIDGVGTVAALEPVHPRYEAGFNEQTTDWTLRVRVAEHARRWMVDKGSVAIEGISLTIAEFDGEVVSIAVLPLTYWRTNLHALQAGATVNVEADVLVKLAYSRMDAEAGKQFDLSEDWLVARGY
jgi:riboflavin synthase